MDDIPFALKNLIDKAADQLDQAGLARSLVKRVKDLAEEVRQPCNVTVVGKINAGKSTFVNALLREKLAMVGVKETTATLNYFRYGVPNSDDTVLCYWQNKGVTNESRQFLDSLQGYDEETLKRSEEIDHLEYYVRDRFLEEITLIDTPGIGGPKKHEERAMGIIVDRLRNSHDIATRDAHDKADVIIYLLDANEDRKDEELLEEFRKRTQGQERVMNAIGVIARIDQNQERVQRRVELATNMADRLRKSLNTVLPVSARLEQTLGEIERQIEPLVAAIRHISKSNLNWLLESGSEDIFDEYQSVWASASSPEEVQLLQDFVKSGGWGVFVTFARLASKADRSNPELLRELRDIAGFTRLRELLEKRFEKNGQGRLLHCYQIVRKLREILHEVKYEYRSTFFDEEEARKKQREPFLDYLKCLKDPLARELEMFVEEKLAPRLDPASIVNVIERELDKIKETLELHNGDIVALQWIEDQPSLFGREEEELRKLFSYYTRDINEQLQDIGRDRKYVENRKKYWAQKSRQSNNPIVCQVAAQATRRYTSVLHSFPDPS